MAGRPRHPPDLLSTAAWTDLADRGTVLATGNDSVAFIDKFATAAVAGLGPGNGTESFFADARGWVLAFATLLRSDDGLLIDCDAAAAETLRGHLEHHHIREQVSLVDASAAVACIAVAGPGAASWLAARASGGLPETICGHGRIRLDGIEVGVTAVDRFGGDGFILRVRADEAAAVRRLLAAGGLTRVEAAAFDAARIESVVPVARDIPEKTLPQELARDQRAISFTKGCYLGQETVARIDSLGHVNRRLALVAVDAAEVPPEGAAVLADGTASGILTSTASSPRLGPCGLALVHRRGLDPAAALTVAGRPAQIVAAAVGPGA